MLKIMYFYSLLTGKKNIVRVYRLLCPQSPPPPPPQPGLCVCSVQKLLKYTCTLYSTVYMVYSNGSVHCTHITLVGAGGRVVMKIFILRILQKFGKNVSFYFL